MKPVRRFVFLLVALLPICANAADDEVDKFIKTEARTLSELMERLIREYDLTLAVEVAMKALPSNPDFLRRLEQRGLNLNNPTPAEAARIKEAMTEFLQFQAELKPEVLAWMGLMQSQKTPWSRAIRYYNRLESLERRDAVTTLVMLSNHPKQSEADGEQWLQMLKEVFHLQKDEEVRTAALMIAAVELPDLLRTNVTGAILTDLATWLAELEKSTLPRGLSQKVRELQRTVVLLTAQKNPASEADLKAKFAQLQLAASKGDAESTYEVGRMYAEAEGTPRDYAKAMEWFRKADAAGFARAARGIGHLYTRGMGVKTDHSEAARWYRKAAEGGDPVGTENLAGFYQTGTGVEKDISEEFRWALKGAQVGSFKCQVRLGQMYKNGQGTGKNPREALKWLEKGTQHESPEDNHWLALAHNLLGALFTDGSLLINGEKALYHFRQAVELGDDDAPFNLGTMYRDALGVERNLIEAFKWFCLAAARGQEAAMQEVVKLIPRLKGDDLITALGRTFSEYGEEVNLLKNMPNADDPQTQVLLGIAYSEGKGVLQDSVKAVEWYRKAAEKSQPQACHALARMYQKGNGVEKDLSEAAKWFRKALDAGETESGAFLGMMQYEGEGVPKNLNEAFKSFMIAARGGHGGSQGMVGMMYHLGEGTERNLDEGNQWLLKSAAQNDAHAQYLLAHVYARGNGVEKDMRQALEWLHKSGDSGSVKAQKQLGLRYLNGKDVPQDNAKGLEWLKKAARRKDAEALFLLGLFYGQNGPDQDFVEAYKWLSLAADLGHTESTKHRDEVRTVLKPEELAEAKARAKAFLSSK